MFMSVWIQRLLMEVVIAGLRLVAEYMTHYLQKQRVIMATLEWDMDLMDCILREGLQYKDQLVVI